MVRVQAENEGGIDLKTKTVMILGGNEEKIDMVRGAIKHGYKVVVVDRNENAPGFSVEGVEKEYISINDNERVLEAAQRHNIDGILTVTDKAVRTVAYVATQLGLPGISEEAAFMGTNKAAMRKRLKERGVPIPKFYTVQTKEEYLEAISHFEDKCVVKAVDNAGSQGIMLLHDMSDQQAIADAYDYCKKYSGSGELVLEEYMEGPEICVETLSSNGVCYPIQITDQQAKEPPYFTDCGYNQPSLLDEETQKRIRQVAIDANMALENYQGSSCTEMIVTREGPKIVELGLRLAGDYMTAKMVPLSTGIDMVTLAVQVAAGDPIDITPTLKMASVVRYFMKERVGKISEIVGVEEALQMPGVKAVKVLKNVGDIATELRGSADRLCCVITQAETPEEAIQYAETALQKIDFVVEK